MFLNEEEDGVGDWFNDVFATESPPEDVLFDTQLHLPFLILMFVIIIVFALWLISRFFLSDAYKGNWISYLPLLFVLSITIVMLFLLISNKIHFQVVEGGEGTGVLFSLALALMIMPYSNAVLTGSFKIESKLALYTLFAIVVYLAVSNIGQIGFRVVFNIDLDLAFVFSHKTFQTNSVDGILFIIENIGLWLSIFAASFGIEMFS
jgi:hypothetical protein